MTPFTDGSALFEWAVLALHKPLPLIFHHSNEGLKTSLSVCLQKVTLHPLDSCTLVRVTAPWLWCVKTPTWFQCSHHTFSQHFAALWTPLDAELKPSTCPCPHRNMAYIPDPTEKLQVSCSHVVLPAAFRSLPNNSHPCLISTFKPGRKLTDHTPVCATLNLKCGKYIHTHEVKCKHTL